ncbi:protein kinase C-binding protein 1-like isoform X2 [Acanthaster planci]|nr:protein kinase C-binding protein 1-like isoform X2 [Acanthaster planci]
MKREAPAFMDKILHGTKSPKDGKTAPKRKLSQSSPNGNRVGLKNKADYVPPSSKKRKIVRSNRDQDSRNDFYCWVCHKEGSVICCELCPRVYHSKCAKLETDPVGDWFCPECKRATNAECVDSQSKAMSSLTQDQLAKLLLYALKRMRHTGAEPFLKPVNTQQNPGYEEFVFNPMDLSSLEKNIKKRMYGSTEAFLLDAKWILHNCIVFNGSHHKLTNSARMIIKICEYEMKEIEICPDCYLSASVKRDNWFCEVCRDPHKLVWAKLQGFPFWPSKVIREKDGLLDVRFFGQHDRAWVPVTSCYMYCPEIPNPSKKKTSGLSTSIMEMEIHIENLKKTFGKDCFLYAPHRTPYGTFECLTIDPKDRQKWTVREPETLMNGVLDGSSPQPDQAVLATKIKSEPMDRLEAAEKVDVTTPSDSWQGQTVTNTTLAKDAISSGKDSSQESENKTSAADGESASEDKQSGPDLSVKSMQVNSDEVSAKHGGPTVVRRQIFNITRKRTPGGDKSTTKISDTLETGPTSSGKPNSGTVESDDSALSSPSKAPAGVFEVSDESLDVDPEVEAQSPAVQLLGKTHVSTNDFARSLAVKLSKVSPRTLGKMGRQASLDAEQKEGDQTGNMMDCDSQSGQVTEKGTVAKQNGKKTKLSGNSGDQAPAVQNQEKEDSWSNTPESSPVTGDTSDQNTKDSELSKTGLEVDPSEKLSPDGDTPSTSQQSLPRKDKFHMKLEKTIETMKASLGIERLHSVDKETSDSESSAADSDSDSSEAEHSEDSDMEVDNDRGQSVSKKGLQSPNMDGSDKATTSSDGATQSLATKLVHDTTNQSSDTNPDKEPFSKDPIKPDQKKVAMSPNVPSDVRGSSTSQKTWVDADIDLVMSCHSEMSGSEEGELVIDESRTNSKVETKGSKIIQKSEAGATKSNKSSEKLEQSAELLKLDVQEDPAPMETDDVILVSDPFESHEADQTDQSTVQQGETAPLSPKEHEEKTETSEEISSHKEVSQETSRPEDTANPNEETLRTDEPHSPPPVSPSTERPIVSPTPERPTVTDNSSAPLKDTSQSDTSQANTLQTAQSSKKATVASPTGNLPPPKDTPSSSVSSFPKIVETLQASKRPVIVPDPPLMTNTEKSDKNATSPVTKDAASSSVSSETVEESQPASKDKDTSMKAFYKKYIEKISASAEGMLEEFCSDMSEGVLLKEAKATIEELKAKVLQLTVERDQERKEFKQIMDLAVAEVRECMKEETRVALANLKNQLEAEKQDEIRKTKTKQWCANCGKDAVFFCCWNTSYCDYPCQQSHWSQHRNTCQQRSLGNTATQVQQAPSKPQQITMASTTQAPNNLEITQIISPAAGKSASEQLRLISNQQANQTEVITIQPSQPVPMQIHSNVQPTIQQPMNQTPNRQPVHLSQLNQPTNLQQQQPQPLRQTLQQQQQVMQPSLAPANTQPMQTLIQYVQAPRMSAPLPVRQMLNHHPYTMPQGRIIGNGMRAARP